MKNILFGLTAVLMLVFLVACLPQHATVGSDNEYIKDFYCTYTGNAGEVLCKVNIYGKPRPKDGVFWEWGDDSFTSTGGDELPSLGWLNVQHQYSTGGFHPVKLTVYFIDGRKITVEDTVTISK